MLAIQEHNGSRGEARTMAILLDEFWVWKRSVDVEGADFLVQIPAVSAEDLAERRNRIQSIGIVQAKYFESRNQVRIRKEYVVEGDGPCPEFFAILHTDDEDGKHHYFFSASDIVGNFYPSSCGKYLCFSLANSRDYSEYLDVPEKRILSTIRSAVLRAEQDRNRRFVKRLYNIFEIPTKHYDPRPRFTYILTYVDTHPIVLCRNEKNGHRHLLEYRRDLFKNLGNFSWGYVGTGSRFLSTCLLAHHFDGAAPSKEMVQKLLYNIIRSLDQHIGHTITSDQIRAAIDSTN